MRIPKPALFVLPAKNPGSQIKGTTGIQYCPITEEILNKPRRMIRHGKYWCCALRPDYRVYYTPPPPQGYSTRQ